MYDALIGRLNENAVGRLHEECLVAVRILSREKSGLDPVSTEHALATLLRHAGLLPPLEEEEDCAGDQGGSVCVQDTAGLMPVC